MFCKGYLENLCGTSAAIENMVRLRISCRKYDEAPTIWMLYLKVQELSDQINSIVRKKRDLRRLKSEPYAMIDDFSIENN